MSTKFLSWVLILSLALGLIYFTFIRPNHITPTSNLAAVILSENEKQAMVKDLSAQIDARLKAIADLQVQISELLKPAPVIPSAPVEPSTPPVTPPVIPPPVTPPASANSPSITLTPASSTIRKGQTLQLRALFRNSLGQTNPNLTYTWTTTDDRIARVSSSGIVTAGEAQGIATITASREAGKITGTATVIVSNP